MQTIKLKDETIIVPDSNEQLEARIAALEHDNDIMKESILELQKKVLK